MINTADRDITIDFEHQHFKARGFLSETAQMLFKGHSKATSMTHESGGIKIHITGEPKLIDRTNVTRHPEIVKVVDKTKTSNNTETEKLLMHAKNAKGFIQCRNGTRKKSYFCKAFNCFCQ